MEQTENIGRRTNDIQRLNDDLRCRGRGGKIVVTNGIAALAVDEVDKIFAAVQSFDAFTADNDPFGEHDCAVLSVGSRRIIWKIDYYDRSRRHGSSDPANAKETSRLMTVMLAEEY